MAKVQALFLLLILPLFGKGQTIDTELWLDLKGKYEFTKKLDAGFEFGYRRDENLSRARIIFIEPELEFEVVDNLDLSIQYRHSILPNSVPDRENRLSFAVQYRHDFGKLDISYRFKYQEDYLPELSKVPQLRNRIKFDYNLSKKFDPYFQTELFYDNQASQKEFEQLRFEVGGEINLPKGRSLTIYYLLRNRFNVGTPGNYHIMGLSFNFGKVS